MAFKDSDIQRELGSMLESSTSKDTAGLEVFGVDATLRVIEDFKGMALYVTTMTSKLVAESIYWKSQDHVPYDTGELYESGFVESVGGGSIKGGGKLADVKGKYTPSVETSLEGVGDYNKILPDISPTISVAGRFGGREYNRLVVGYSAEHAVMVHENPYDQEWVNPNSKSPRMGIKTDHFLLNAYNVHRDVFSSAMTGSLQQAIAAAAAAAQKTAVEATAAARYGTSGITPGAPRLMRRT